MTDRADRPLTDHAETQARAGRRAWIGLAVLVLPSLLVSMDVTVLYLALPEISADLEPSSSQLLWITDIYGFLIAGALITMGTLGDRIGRRRLLLLGAIAFGIASLLAAFSTSSEMLIAARALLGIAGATLMPSTLSLIRTMFANDEQRTTAIGVWVTSLSLGAAIGPLLGGLLLEHFWWGSVFLVNVPVMGLLLAVGPKLLPEFRDPDAGRIDLVSAALSLVAVLSAIYGVKQFAEDGGGWLPALAIAAGLALGALFVRRQRVTAVPLIDLALFRSRGFSAALAVNALAFFVMLGIYLYLGQYLQLVFGQGPLEAGLWLLPYAGAVIAGSMAASMIVRRVPGRWVVAGGLTVAAVGFGTLAQIDGDSGLAALVIGSVLMGLGLAPVLTLGTDMIVGAAPPERAGSASAVSETSFELGGALGVAILGSIGTAVYRSELADTIPAGVSPATAEAARDTLGGARELTGPLPTGVDAELLTAAQDAFVQGLQVAATVSAAIALAVAVIALRTLRQTDPDPASPPDPESAVAAPSPASGVCHSSA